MVETLPGSGRISKAVFPAAGLGTRFLPASKSVPKEMLTLVDKPVIQYAVEEAVASGLREVVLVTSRGKHCMEDHFDRAPELEAALARRGKKAELDLLEELAGLVSVRSIRQAEALGLGHAVLTARPLVGDESFAVVLGDDVIQAEPPCLRQLLDVHQRTQASVICVEDVPRAETASYGIVAGERVDEQLVRVTGLVEKPRPSEAPSTLGIIGRYILTPGIFTALGRTRPGAGGEIQLTDALELLLETEPVYAYRFQGRRHDAGAKLGYLRATVELALSRADLGEPFRDYLRSLRL